MNFSIMIDHRMDGEDQEKRRAHARALLESFRLYPSSELRFSPEDAVVDALILAEEGDERCIDRASHVLDDFVVLFRRKISELYERAYQERRRG